MAYGIIHHFPGGNREQYDASIAAVHPGDGAAPGGADLPRGRPIAGGWTIIAVHDGQESWERFAARS